MERSAIVRWSVVVIVCTCQGCMSTGRLNPQTWFRNSDAESVASTDDDDSKEGNPLKKASSKKKKKLAKKKNKDKTAIASGKDSQKKTEKIAKASPAKKSEIQTVSHDADILAMIESEMQYLPPGEREQFSEGMKGQDPAFVRSLLSTLRLARRMNEQAPNQQIAQASADYNSGIVDPALTQFPRGGHSGSPQSFSSSSPPPSGMGNVQPWGNSTPADVGRNNQLNYQQQYAGNDFPNSTFSPGSHSTRLTNPATNVTSNLQTDPRYAATNYRGSQRPVGSLAMQQGMQTSQQLYQQGFMQQPALPGSQVAMSNGGPQSVAHSGSLVGARGGFVNQQPGSQFQQQPTQLPGMTPAVSSQLQNGYITPVSQDGRSGQTMSAQFNAPSQQPTNVMNLKWNEDLSKLISLAEATTSQLSPGPSEAEKKEYIEHHVHLRLLYLMSGQQKRALEAIRDIDSADQEFWQQVLWSLSSYFDNEIMPNPGDRATATVTQLRTAIQRLQENANLVLRNVNFCRKITKFGDYERFAREEFSPGQEVLVYAEINNFKSEPTADGLSRSILRSTIEIYKAGPNGDLVAKMPFDPTEDLCFSRRNDYFNSYVVSIPPGIALGPYVLKLRVEDQLSRKMAEYPLKFTVGQSGSR